MTRSGEFDLIRDVFAPLAEAPGALGLADDAALVHIPAGRELVVTADTLIEGVHFLMNDPADLIARKALRVNLSDLASKGARPDYYFLCLSLASWVDDSWLTRFGEGLAADQKSYGVSLMGGDTTATPGPLTISITAMGSVEAGRMIKRSGAHAGDLVFVTGTIGDAGAGLAVLNGASASADRGSLIRRYQLPEPRTGLGQKLVPLAHASVDISDGLMADLGHVAAASGLRIVVDAARVPLSEGVRALWGSNATAAARAATSGDDYEIAFTAPYGARGAVAALSSETGIAISEIGRVEPGEGIDLLNEAGRAMPLQSLGFRHF